MPVALFSLDLYSYSKASRCTTLGTLLRYLPPLSVPLSYPPPLPPPLRRADYLVSLARTRIARSASAYPLRAARGSVICQSPRSSHRASPVRAFPIGRRGSARASEAAFSYSPIHTARVCHYASRQPPLPPPSPPPLLPLTPATTTAVAGRRHHYHAAGHRRHRRYQLVLPPLRSVSNAVWSRVRRYRRGSRGRAKPGRR